jgi:glycosyltransferase involved in cell wall biosynthesis
MKIALVGPGIMSIPPVGWGAVEILIWDYFMELSHQGHEVDIINKMRQSGADQFPNTQYTRELIGEINAGDYDIVHIHYDCLCHIIPLLTAKKILITSHYPYIDQPDKHAGDGFQYIFQIMCQNKNHSIFALSKKDYDAFVKHAFDPSNVYILLNGANHNEIAPLDREGLYAGRTVYIGKVEARKKQKKYSNLSCVDFYGKCDDSNFKTLACYKGEKEHGELMGIMREYGSLALLSDGENGTPLVIKEALMAGLPVVINRHSANDLAPNLPFVDIIPDDKLDDFEYIERVLQESRAKKNRDEIRKYAVENFSWDNLVNTYIRNIS